MRYHQFATILGEAAAPVTGPTRDQIIAALNKLGQENVKIDGNKLKVLVQIPDGEKKNQFRTQVMADVLIGLKNIFPKYNPRLVQSSKYGSQGAIEMDGTPVAVLIKDVGVQGDKSSGVANEKELASFIQSMIEKYGTANVTFVDPRGKKMFIKNVDKVTLAGRDTKGRKKADVILSNSQGGSLPISIKKLDADAWESADSLFGPKAKEILTNLQQQGVIKLKKFVDDKGRKYYQLNKEIVVEPTEEEAMNAIFGSDLMPKGGVVVQTFKPEHYVQDGNNITIECHAVITNKEDIPESHLMVWLIRNNVDRNNPLPGLRTLGVTLKRGIGAKGTKDVVLVDRNGNVVERPTV